MSFASENLYPQYHLDVRLGLSEGRGSDHCVPNHFSSDNVGASYDPDPRGTGAHGLDHNSTLFSSLFSGVSTQPPQDIIGKLHNAAIFILLMLLGLFLSVIASLKLKVTNIWAEWPPPSFHIPIRISVANGDSVSVRERREFTKITLRVARI
jgi:hypothetical protein